MADPCGRCYGAGWVIIYDPFTDKEAAITCPDCKGRGRKKK